MDPKKIVAEGYDRIAEQYRGWASQIRIQEREHYTQILLDRLPDGADVLDLGCATGELLTARLAQRFSVIGVDISARQIELARQRVPQAGFIRADMTQLRFPPASFAAVAAFYSLTHLPREQLASLLRSIASWLRPGGLLVASLGAGSDVGSVEDDWLGVPMFFSGFDSAASRQMVVESGFEIESAREETDDEDGQPITFLWVVARSTIGQSEP